MKVRGKWDKHGRYHPSESEVTKGIRDVLDSAGVWHWKHWSGGFTGLAGISDLLGIYEIPVESLVRRGIKTVGIFMACEIKKPGKKLTEAQVKFLEQVNLHHGIGVWADSTEECVDKLKLRARLYPLFSKKGGNGYVEGEGVEGGPRDDQPDRPGAGEDGQSGKRAARPGRKRRVPCEA
jgi:hypothetical protein